MFARFAGRSLSFEADSTSTDLELLFHFCESSWFNSTATLVCASYVVACKSFLIARRDHTFSSSTILASSCPLISSRSFVYNNAYDQAIISSPSNFLVLERSTSILLFATVSFTSARRDFKLLFSLLAATWGHYAPSVAQQKYLDFRCFFQHGPYRIALCNVFRFKRRSRWCNMHTKLLLGLSRLFDSLQVLRVRLLHMCIQGFYARLPHLQAYAR